jgi:hypothetical protein
MNALSTPGAPLLFSVKTGLADLPDLQLSALLYAFGKTAAFDAFRPLKRVGVKA